MTPRAPVVVLGGSVAGLSAAVLLARSGHEVVVVDRDPRAGTARLATPVAGDVTPRRATAQAAHSHIFLARLRALLLERAPDVHRALLANGARELPLRQGLPPALAAVAGDPAAEAHLGDGALVAIAARRTTVEEALRAVALAEPGVTVLAGRVASGLRWAPSPEGGPAVVAGVGLDDGTGIDTDLVVDASGRRTPVPGWLAAAGVEVALEASECGISYLSRFYRSRPGRVDPPLTRGFTAGGSFDGWSCLVFPADDGTFSVTFGLLPEDRGLRALADPVAFDAAVAAIPSLAPWTAPEGAKPISGVAAMSGLKNRLRRTVHDGRPAVVGLVAIGDAAATSNPAHSRGCTLAVVHAAAMADAVARHRGAPEDLALAADAILDAELAPWVADSVEQDAQRLARWRPGAPAAPAARPDRLTNGELHAGAQADPALWRRFSRMQQLLDPPSAVLGDPELVATVRSRPVAAAPAGAGAAGAPTREALLEALGRRDAPLRRRGRVTVGSR